MRLSRLTFLGLFAYLLSVFTTTSVFSDEKPVEYFFDKPSFTGAKLSPDGNYLAALVPIQDRMNIAVIELATNKARNVTSVKNQDISNFMWANNNRLLFFMDRDGNESLGIFAVDKDGKRPRTLAKPGFASGDIRYTRILNLLDNDEDYILVTNNKRRAANPDVYRMNVMNGKQRLIQRNPGNVSGWILDWDGNVVGANISDRLNNGFTYLNPKTGEWEEHINARYDEASYSLAGVKADGVTAFVTSTMTPDGKQRDKSAIYEYDLQTKKIGDLIFEHPVVDVSGVGMREKTKDISAIAYMVGKPEVKYFDSERRKMMALINDALPNTINSIASMSDDEKVAVIVSSSDIQPPMYYLYRVEEKTIEPIGEAMPWVKADEMSSMQPIKFTARDGLTLYGYLTVPNGSNGKNLPLIINPHGGPWARDGWGFNPEVQFFANRGYAVLQVNFRGSTGFGKNHLIDMAKKQWGQAMQNDVTDAVKWAISEGIANPEKVCIAGGSYGGYAVMAGLTFTPDLYQCGINTVGVTDLGLLFETMPESWGDQKYFMQDMIGKDPEFLAKWSPTNHADKIKVPVLMGYGKRDIRVNIKHAYKMEEGLKANDVDYELIVFDNEGHGFVKKENRVKWYTKVDEFLERNL